MDSEICLSNQSLANFSTLDDKMAGFAYELPGVFDPEPLDGKERRNKGSNIHSETTKKRTKIDKI